MAQKINWKLFSKESCVLIGSTLFFGFFLKVSLVLFQYYKAPALSLVALSIGLCFGLPLLTSLLDIWARLVLSVGEPAIAEKMFRLSMSWHARLFGMDNSSYASKQALLADLYFRSGRTAEATSLFQESWSSYKKARFKFPLLNGCFSNYLKLLDTTFDTAARAGQEQDKQQGLNKEIKAELRNSGLVSMAQAVSSLAVTLPIVTFLFQNQMLEIAISKHNADGQTVLALREITTLAERESAILGPYAAARVYRDYVHAFGTMDDPQDGESAWCADKGLQELKRSGISDDYLKVVLLNVKAEHYLNKGSLTQAEIAYEEAASLCSAWSQSQLSEHNNDARFERDTALLGLGEILRNRGEYEKAQAYYETALGWKDGEFRPDLQSVDMVRMLDRIHKLQHIENKLGKKDRSIQLQKIAANMIESKMHGILQGMTSPSPMCDFGVREAARELDACALLLKDAGKVDEAKSYSQRADKLRQLQRKRFELDKGQRDSLVDTSTRITNELLAVKYKAGDWQGSLKNLLEDELNTKGARSAFQRLSWFDPDYLKVKSKNLRRSERTLEIDIFPLSVRSNRAGEGVAIDVQGTVRIKNADSKKKLEEQKFAFAYIMQGDSEHKNNRPQVLELYDNQSYGRMRLD